MNTLLDRLLPLAIVLFTNIILSCFSSRAVAGIEVFNQETEFLQSAPIVSTETFDSYSPTIFGPQVQIDQIFYSADSNWQINPILSFPPTPPNVLGTQGIGVDTINFGENQYVHALGFYFLGGGSSDGVLASYNIALTEIDNEITQIQFSPEPITKYFGFLSDRGIKSVEIRPTGESKFFYVFDNVSRSTLESVGTAPFTATPNVLWPPNNKLVLVTISPTQAGLLSCQITSVSSNELITSSDYQITEPLTVKLRAQRLESGRGRVYTIDIGCLDASGNPVTGNVTVTVPHDQGKAH